MTAIRDSKQSEMHTAIPHMWTHVDLLGNTMLGNARRLSAVAVSARPRRLRDG